MVSLIEISLVILLAQQLASLSWQILDRSEQLDPWKPEATASTTSIQEHSPYPQLANMHLFGKEPVQVNLSEEALPDPNSVPRSRLSARVTGILASSIPANALAVIKSGRQERTYRIGETLQGTNAEIIDIYPDRVIVLNRSQHEALLLYPDNADQKVVRRPSGQLAGVRQQLISNPASITEYVRISPFLRDGRLAGYQLNPGSRPQLFSTAGLQVNDLAVNLNGFDLTNNSEAMQLMQTLPSLTQISLTIERDGRPHEINITL